MSILELYPRQRFIEGVDPKPCTNKGCDPSSQIFYWRTFTNKSIRSFYNQEFTSTVPDFIPLSKKLNGDEQTNHESWLIPASVLETPGNLWTSSDPFFALAVGLSRSVLENENETWLLGVNHCPHSTESGVHGYKVIKKSNVCILHPLENGEHDFRGLTIGTIFNRFTSEQVKNGVMYQVDPHFIRDLREAYLPFIQSATHTEDTYNEISFAISSVFYRMLSQIGHAHQDENRLLEIYHPLLSSPIASPVFPVYDTMAHFPRPRYGDGYAHMLIQNIIHEMQNGRTSKFKSDVRSMLYADFARHRLKNEKYDLALQISDVLQGDQRAMLQQQIEDVETKLKLIEYLETTKSGSEYF